MLDTRGLHDKFEVRRKDGTDQPGGKHDGCFVFVLDVDHDPCARAALAAYIEAAKDVRPRLARDLEVLLACLEAEEGVDK